MKQLIYKESKVWIYNTYRVSDVASKLYIEPKHNYEFKWHCSELGYNQLEHYVNTRNCDGV